MEKWTTTGNNGVREVNCAKLQSGKNVYVGCGINVLTATGPDAFSVLAPLFNETVYHDTTGKYITIQSINKSENKSTVSENLVDVYQDSKIEVKGETGGAIAFFTGDIATQYGSSKQTIQNRKYYSSIASVEIEKHLLNAVCFHSEASKKLMIEGFAEDLDDEMVSPEDLFSKYGTHIIKSASIGGNIEVNALYEAREAISVEDFGAAMDLACSYVSVHAKGEASEKQKEIIRNSSIHSCSYGGDVTIAASLTSFDEIKSSFIMWAKSITANENQVLSCIYEYLPIWKLASDKKRQEEIFKVFMAAALDNGFRVSLYFKPQRYKLMAKIGSETTNYVMGTILKIPSFSYLSKNGIGSEQDTFTVYNYESKNKNYLLFSNLREAFLRTTIDEANIGYKGRLMAYRSKMPSTGPEPEELFQFEAVEDGYCIKSYKTGQFIGIARIEGDKKLYLDAKSSKENAVRFKTLHIRS